MSSNSVYEIDVSINFQRVSGLIYPFFGRVGIVEANNHLSVVHFGKILVENGSLGVSDVQITRGLRGEACNNSSVDGILKSESKAGGRLI